MIDVSSIGVRVLIGVVVIILAFVLLKFFTADKEDSITEYAAPVPKRSIGILKSPKNLVRKLESMPPVTKASWAPSPVDASMTPYGEWDTNRFQNSFVTNVAAGFPENDEGASAARPTKWTPPTAANMTIPDLTMRSELGPLPTPPIGSDDPFNPELGAAF
jgi:hypothetical protein